MSRIAKVSVGTHEVITVLDDAGAAVTGLVSSDFTKSLTKNGAVDATAVTVTEINSSTRPGEYDVTFTPGSTGYWRWRVWYAGDLFGFEQEWDITTDGLLALSDIQAYIDAHSTQIALANANIVILLGRLTSTRAGYLDLLTFLDAAITSRMASGGSVDVGSFQSAAMAALTAYIGSNMDIDGKGLVEALRYIAATTCGESSGDPGTPTFKGLDGTTDRLSAVVDSNGNRTAVVLDP